MEARLWRRGSGGGLSGKQKPRAVTIFNLKVSFHDEGDQARTSAINKYCISETRTSLHELLKYEIKVTITVSNY